MSLLRPPRRARAARLTAPLLATCGTAMLLGCASPPPQPMPLAVQPLMRLQQSSDQSAAAWYQLGKYHQERGQTSLAMGAYAQSLALDGRQLDARMAVAAIDARQGRLAEARDALLALVVDYPAQAQLSNNLGYVYHLMGDQQAAIAMLRRALALDAASARAQDNLRLAEAAAAAAASGTQLAATAQSATSAPAAAPAAAPIPAPALALPPGPALAPAFPAAFAPVAPAAAGEALDAGLPPPTRAELRQVQEQLRQLQVRHAAIEATAAAAAKTAADAAASLAAASPVVPPVPALAPALPPPRLSAIATAAAPATATAASPVPLEISNGNGAPGLAKRFRRALAQLGIPVGRLSNDKPYRQQQTIIEYRPGYRQQASELQAALRGQATLQDAGPRSRSSLRLVLGKDAPTQLASAEEASTLLAALGAAAGTGTGN